MSAQPERLSAAFTPDVRFDSPPETCTHGPEGAIHTFLSTVTDASLVFLTRFPTETVFLLRPERLIEQALVEVLLEPCTTTLVPFDACTIAVIVTPETAQPYDPLHTHGLLEMFRRELHQQMGLPAVPLEEESRPIPLIVPLARVSSVSLLQENLTALNELLETLINKRLRVQFQPIIHLPSAQVYGYEALIRVPQGGVLKRPGMMFGTADKARLVSWVDVACQETCFAEAGANGVTDYLFINMDAEGLAYLHLGERSLADRASEYAIAPTRIVLEITERQAVDDFPRLTRYIEELRQQGFKVAIDDVGAGYSSLHTIADLRPEFVKIDRSLVRSIESNGSRRALLRTLAQYAAHIGTSIIAEGIETPDELATVIEAGVEYAQGYLLGKPNDHFKGLRRVMQERVAQQMDNHRRLLSGRSYPISAIAQHGTRMTPDSTVEQVYTKFTKNPDLQSIVIVAEDERIVGLVMRRSLLHRLETCPDALQQPITAHMEPQPLIVEAETRVEEVAHRATHRRETGFHADVLVAKGAFYVGLVPAHALMKALTTLQVNRARYAHPLTQLPGSVVGEQETNERLASGAPTACLLFDIAHFRAFNARFGIAHGDDLLSATARLIERALAEVEVPTGSRKPFLSHLGADRFFVLLPPTAAETVCRECVAQYEALLPSFCAAPQRETHHGAGLALPAEIRPSLRIVATDNRVRPLHDFTESWRVLKTLLRTAKTFRASRYMLDRETEAGKKASGTE